MHKITCQSYFTKFNQLQQTKCCFKIDFFKKTSSLREKTLAMREKCYETLTLGHNWMHFILRYLQSQSMLSSKNLTACTEFKIDLWKALSWMSGATIQKCYTKSCSLNSLEMPLKTSTTNCNFSKFRHGGCFHWNFRRFKETVFLEQL